MKKLLLLALLATGAPATAQDFGQAATVHIWDNATAPHSNRIDASTQDPARMHLTTDAKLYIFAADRTKATGQAVVICPGGSYHGLAIGHEGLEMAKWLAENGITAAVLKYRMPNGHAEVPREDAEMALRIMRGQEPGAEGFTASKVGIIGCSAGGHLAATISTLCAEKPAFAILFYPVISGDPTITHKGSFDNLLGEGRTAEQTAPYWLENRVTEQTPPTLILFSDDDDAVPAANGARYYNALKAHGIKASLHIYPTGGHGWGFNDSFAYKAAWQAAALDWLEKINQQGFIAHSPKERLRSFRNN